MLSAIRLWIKENAERTISGGAWAKAVSYSTQKNLRWFFLDGVLGASLDGIAGPFLTLYMLALGATIGQIGLMTSLAGLCATFMLLPGALLAERSGKRKLIFVLCGAGIARFTILASAFLPFILTPSVAIYFIIALKVIGDGLGNFSGPAWMSLAGDIVPLAWRGRYFGSRNFFMSISSMAATFLAGLPALRLFGHLSDHWGAKKVQLVTGFLLPLLPPIWILARVPLHGILINIPGGILWAGFNLASFNFLLALAPSEKRARYTALFQLAVALSSAAGTFLGSLIISRWGYFPIFALCGIGRFVGIFYFAQFVHLKDAG